MSVQEVNEELITSVEGEPRPEYGAGATRANRAGAWVWPGGAPAEVDLFSGYAVETITFPITDLDDVIDILTRLRDALAGLAPRERRLLGLAMAGQTNATDIVKSIASIALGSCT